MLGLPAPSVSICTSVFSLTGCCVEQVGLRVPRAVRALTVFPPFLPAHALISALLKDLLLSGPFCGTLGPWVVWRAECLQPTMWGLGPINLSKILEVTQSLPAGRCGCHKEMTVEHKLTARGTYLLEWLRTRCLSDPALCSSSLQRWMRQCAPSQRRSLPLR